MGLNEMKLKEMVQDLKENSKRNRVIIINKKSSEYLKEFKKLNIKPIDLSLELSKLVRGLSDDEKKHEGVDKLNEFLENIERDVIALDNVQYVFSEELGNINIISNLNYFTRERKVVILFFDGKNIDNKLIYSSEDKNDYKAMDISQNAYVLGWDV